MALQVLTLVWNDGHPEFSPPAGTTDLNTGDSLEVQLVGAGGAGTIEWLKVYTAGNGGPGEEICEWTATVNGEDSVYSIGATAVTLTDIEDNRLPQKFWFTLGGTGWRVDPELVNRGDSGGG